MNKKSYIKVTDFSTVVTEQTGKNQFKVYITFEDVDCFFVGEKHTFEDKSQAEQCEKRLVAAILRAAK